MNKLWLFGCVAAALIACDGDSDTGTGGSGGADGGAGGGIGGTDFDGGTGGVVGGSGGAGGSVGGSGGSVGGSGGSVGGSGGSIGGSGGSLGGSGGSVGGAGGNAGGEGGVGGTGGAGGGGGGECTIDECGPVPPVAPCPGGEGPAMSCERWEDGSCGWHIAPCEAICGGFAGFVCEADQYCDFPDGALCGAADQTGLCQSRPAVCEPIDGLLCGCDGVEYESDCAAAAAGTDVAFPGPCGDVPVCGEGACGGPPPVAACNDGSVPPMSCEPGDGGVCQWLVGECPAEPVRCGGRLGDRCTDLEFCDFERDGCDFADASGVCQPRPEACAEIFAPVCGCNGVTYDNLCFAQGAGVDAAADGPCAN